MIQEYEKVLNEYIIEVTQGRELSNLQVMHMNKLWEKKLQNARFQCNGDYQPVSKERVSDSQVRMIAAYAMSVMSRYINDIRAASYPQTASQVGGWVYDYILIHLENMNMMADGKTVQEIKELRQSENVRLGIKPITSNDG